MHGSERLGEKSAAFDFAALRGYSIDPQHFLNFLPLPHGHGTLRTTFVLFAGVGRSDAPGSVPSRMACFFEWTSAASCSRPSSM